MLKLQGFKPAITQEMFDIAEANGAPQEVLDSAREELGKPAGWVDATNQNIPPIQPIMEALMRKFVADTGAPAVRMVDEDGTVVAFATSEAAKIAFPELGDSAWTHAPDVQ